MRQMRHRTATISFSALRHHTVLKIDQIILLYKKQGQFLALVLLKSIAQILLGLLRYRLSLATVAATRTRSATTFGTISFYGALLCLYFFLNKCHFHRRTPPNLDVYEHGKTLLSA